MRVATADRNDFNAHIVGAAAAAANSRWTALPQLDEKERARYSIIQALQIESTYRRGSGTLEREYHDAAASALSAIGVQARGILMPIDLAPYAAVDTSGPSGGGNAVFTRALGFLDMLRARSVTAALGATMLADAVPGAYPVQTGSPDAVWVPENPGVDGEEADLELQALLFEAKTLLASTSFSRQLMLLAHPTASVEFIARRDLAGRIASAWDRAAINGPGSAHQPAGILTREGLKLVPIGDNGGAPTYAHMTELEYEVASRNADVGALGFAATPGIRKQLRKTVRDNNGAGFVWENGQVLDHTAIASKNVPSDLVKGTSEDCHAIIFGNWQDLIIASFGVVDLVTDFTTGKKRGMVGIDAYWYGDINARVESFAAVVDARVS